MRGDFSRIRFNRRKGYTSVLEQQGRVALDADANEQCFIDDYLRSSEASDVIGAYGAPSAAAGFQITVSDGEIQIGAGRYYVNGVLCDNPAASSYDSQPFLLGATSGTDLLSGLAVAGTGAVVPVYLQVWQRFVTGLDDPDLLEPALGQADTTGRLQTVWRVIASPPNPTVLPSTPTSGPLSPYCQAMYQAAATPSTGTMTAGTVGATTDCGCAPIPAAGYQGVENQLYRVEIHQGDDETTATFKWSRENGSVVQAVTAVNGSTVQVSSLGPDANLGFQVQEWVELSDDSALFGPVPNQAGTLYQIQSIQTGVPSLTLSGSATAVDPGQNARIRRWDQSGPSASSTGIPLSAATWIGLENGIQVCFAPGTYSPGDYWTIPARTATGTIEWPSPGSAAPTYEPPRSMLVGQAPLGCIHWTPEPATQPYTVDDCRLLFEPLTTLTAPSPPHVHVETVSWTNDDFTTLDQLLADGLTIGLDQVLSSPVNSASFIVTVESVRAPDRDDNIVSFVTEQDPSTLPKTLLRDVTIADSAITVTTQTLPSGASASLLSWQLPLNTPKLQNLEIAALEQLLLTAAPAGLFARVRVKLLGEAIFASGSTGVSYLDGRALGRLGTRADGSARIDLKLPSGQGTLSSDLDGWFYLAPHLQIEDLSTNGPFTVVADFLNDVESVQAPVNNTPQTVTPQATIDLNYPPIAAAAGTPVTLSLSLTGTSVSGGTVPSVSSMASVPASVPLVAGEATLGPVTISIFGNPGTTGNATPTTLTFELTATIALAGGLSTSQSTTFTVTGAPPPAPPIRHGGHPVSG
jgi:hypothetical protein